MRRGWRSSTREVGAEIHAIERADALATRADHGAQGDRRDRLIADTEPWAYDPARVRELMLARGSGL